MMMFLQLLTTFWILGSGLAIWFWMAYGKAWGSQKFSKQETFGLRAVPLLSLFVMLIIPAFSPASIVQNEWLIAALMIFGTIATQLSSYIIWWWFLNNFRA